MNYSDHHDELFGYTLAAFSLVFFTKESGDSLRLSFGIATAI